MGGRKLDRFGADVLALCAGEELGGAEPDGATPNDDEPERAVTEAFESEK